MADPFGMAYGIGAGLAGVPGAIQQGKEDTIRLAMAQLAMQQAQKQQAMEDATDAAMMRDYPTPEQAPIAIQTPANASRLDATNPDAGPSMTPELAEQRNVGIGAKTKTIQPMPNPNVITAHKMLLQSEALQKIGNWRVAQQLRDHAMTYGEKGMKEVRQQFGQMVAGGMFDQAVSALHGMGIQNVVGITPSEDGTSVVLHKDDGTSFDMDDEAIAKFVNPDATAKSAQELLLKREALAIKREELAQKGKLGTRKLDLTETNNLERIKLGYARIRELASSGGAGKTPAAIKTMEYNMRLWLKSNPDKTPEDAFNWWMGRSEKGKLSEGQILNSLDKEQKRILDKRRGREPRPDQPDYLEYKENEKAINELRGSKRAPAPSGGLGNPVAQDSQGRKVYKSGNDYVYADGTKYVEPKG